MANYYLRTIWRIEAPLEQVYAAIENSLLWPDWWLSVRQVEQTADGNAQGDLEGVGRWNFSRQGSVSVVHFEWHVRSTRWWMNLLEAPLVGQETIDLIANPVLE